MRRGVHVNEQGTQVRMFPNHTHVTHDAVHAQHPRQIILFVFEKNQVSRLEFWLCMLQQHQRNFLIALRGRMNDGQHKDEGDDEKCNRCGHPNNDPSHVFFCCDCLNPAESFKQMESSLTAGKRRHRRRSPTRSSPRRGRPSRKRTSRKRTSRKRSSRKRSLSWMPGRNRAKRFRVPRNNLARFHRFLRGRKSASPIRRGSPVRRQLSRGAAMQAEPPRQRTPPQSTGYRTPSRRVNASSVDTVAFSPSLRSTPRRNLRPTTGLADGLLTPRRQRMSKIAEEE